MFKRSIVLCSVLMVLVFAVLVSGCSASTPEATPTATRTPLPIETATPVPPTATATPRPTATPAASATPQSLVVTPFPPDVDPFTGLKLEDATVLDRIPIAIKVSNSPEARPQSGLGSADLVFEHLAEGGITRYTAVFYASDPDVVGSVRSGRLIDLEIPAMYHALFGYSGSSAGVKDRIRHSDLFPDYIAAPDFGVGEPYFYRVPQAGKAFEHTLFTSPGLLRQLADERGINERPDFPAYMAFSETTPAGGEPETYVEVAYSAACTAQWTYDAALGVWDRSIGGVSHVDALTGDQITADNVVLVFANHVYANFWEQMIGDQSAWILSTEIQLWGQGPALVFRDGQMYSGIWKRETRDAMLTFYYGDETPMPLKPGNTWFQVVPLETESTQTGEGQLTFNPPKR